MNWKKGFKRIAVVVFSVVLFSGCRTRYDKGYEEGFKDGYCKDKRIVCSPPEPFKSSKGYPREKGESFLDYEAGYNMGEVNGELLSLKEKVKESIKRTDAELQRLKSN
jgi:hypothetical protein